MTINLAFVSNDNCNSMNLNLCAVFLVDLSQKPDEWELESGVF